jgi:hypothetical protein
MLELILCRASIDKIEKEFKPNGSTGDKYKKSKDYNMLQWPDTE